MRWVDITSFRYPGGDLRYSGGMLTIYGQNGAGKSLLLESIESALTGRLVGRTPANDFDDWMPIECAAVVRGDVGSMFSDSNGPNGSASLDAAVKFADDDVSGLDLPPALAAAWADFHRELSLRNSAVLAPSDSVEPRWRAYLAVHPDNPAAVAWDAELAAHVRTFADPDALDDDPRDRFEGNGGFVIEGHLTDLDGSSGSGGVYRLISAPASVVVDPSDSCYSAGMIPGVIPTPFGQVVSDKTANPDTLVAHWVRRSLGDEPLATAQILAALDAGRAAWVRRANELMCQFLIDPPVLHLVVGGPSDWVSGSVPRWEAAGGLPIHDLSEAERRWSRFAIALSAPRVSAGMPSVSTRDEDGADSVPFLLIDEPERGLHLDAEVHMASGLLALAAAGKVKPIIATHSHSLMDAGQGQIIQIKKTESRGIGTLQELTASQIEEARDYGLRPSSMLRVDRGYLLVEGEHDKQILEAWFADELQSLRVAVLATRGTKNLMTVLDSEFLIERSDALLMSLLDDVALDPLFEMWARVEAEILDGRRSDAIWLIREGLLTVPGRGKDAYGPLLAGTITKGVSERFFPLGMSKKDVLEYLPVSELIAGATSWADLRKEWMRSPSAMADRSGKAYKTWLRKAKGADLSPENLRLIAYLNPPHPELKAMIAKVTHRLA